MRLGLQMYTLRDQLAVDFEGTLGRTADIGYRRVELAGFPGRNPGIVRAMLDRLNLEAVSGHRMFDWGNESDVDLAIEEAQALGFRRLVVPYVPEDDRGDWAAYAARLNPVGQKLYDLGLGLQYHNHDFEFRPGADGKLPIETLIENTDPKLVGFQMDIYWVKYAGQDPIEWIERLKGRLPSVHLKDGKFGGAPEFLPAGHGQIEWDEVVAACDNAGVEFGIVELDTYAGDPMRAVRESYGYFEALGLA